MKTFLDSSGCECTIPFLLYCLSSILSLQNITHAMSLSIIPQHTPASASSYHLRLAIILIFKHAAVLCLSGILAELALTQAESACQRANILSTIGEHFPSPFNTDEQYIGFLLDTNIEAS
ncbi:hypothetical protein EDB92DRAFT_1871432 [Lactarius akahatsu]|uniref:Uncharacterized protein n=1 Tax=Lactarius akahatsu TaxID=416441 RepID=A0AAD4LGK1_9AGAM|nr:hypothetical protein EDB92DRAFT_1871432 [Lactarius akahatsu]